MQVDCCNHPLERRGWLLRNQSGDYPRQDVPSTSSRHSCIACRIDIHPAGWRDNECALTLEHRDHMVRRGKLLRHTYSINNIRIRCPLARAISRDGRNHDRHQPIPRVSRPGCASIGPSYIKNHGCVSRRDEVATNTRAGIKLERPCPMSTRRDRRQFRRTRHCFVCDRAAVVSSIFATFASRFDRQLLRVGGSQP